MALNEKVFGGKLKRLRLLNGFDSVEFGEKLGYSKRSSMISQIESGRGKKMSLKKITKAADLLGVDVSILTDEHEYDEQTLKMFMDIRKIAVARSKGVKIDVSAPAMLLDAAAKSLK